MIAWFRTMTERFFHSHFFLEMSVEHICARPGCGKHADKLCPTCISLGLPNTYFCSQECLKLAWKDHKKYHETELDKMFPIPPPIEE